MLPLAVHWSPARFEIFCTHQLEFAKSSPLLPRTRRYLKIQWLMSLSQGGELAVRDKCSPHEHLIWPTSQFSLSNFEYNIASKRSSMISRYLETM